MFMIRVKLSVPEVEDPIFDDEVTMNNIEDFEKKFDEMNVYDSFKGYKDRIRNDVEKDDGLYNKEYDITRNSFHSKMTTNLKKEEISEKDKKFLQQCKESDLFKKAPKEVMDFLNSLDNIKLPEIDPNEEISFWVTYQATFLTELYSPEFFKRNPNEVIDNIDDLSIKISIPRSELNTKDAFGLVKKKFVNALFTTLNIDPNALGEDFKDSFLAKTGIIYLDIIGVDLTRATREKCIDDSDVDNFIKNLYDEMTKDTDIITYRNIVGLIN